MKTKIEVDLKPFIVPNFVLIAPKAGLKQDGFKVGDKYALSQLDSEILLKMCEEFKMSVFEKAGKKIPSIMSDT